MMKKTVPIVAIVVLILSAVIYTDSRTLNKKKNLYSESLRIGELISKYDSILHKADSIRCKYNILKNKKIDDDDLTAILNKSMNFLKRSDEIKSKHNELIIEYNQIAKLFNDLPAQKLFFSNSLPKELNFKTQYHKPAADH